MSIYDEITLTDLDKKARDVFGASPNCRWLPMFRPRYSPCARRREHLSPHKRPDSALDHFGNAFLWPPGFCQPLVGIFVNLNCLGHHGNFLHFKKLNPSHPPATPLRLR